MFDQSSLERAGNRFKRWPSYAEVSEFFGHAGESQVRREDTPEDNALKVTNIAHTAAAEWIANHRDRFWFPAISDGYHGFMWAWLVKTFASMAASGAISGTFTRADGISRYELERTQDPVPEDWQVAEWREQAAERRRNLVGAPRAGGSGFRQIDWRPGARPQ